ncbi:MAG TPA: DUF6580 family putative transport protein [Patescibacteria group bacterium]|nr:DUF6580 family putative transport protein [Patescibacteria group bacterium]
MAYFFIVGGIILRLVPHLPNFAPIAAMALFGGVYLNKKYALGVPLLALLISDFFIGFYDIGVMISVYSSFFVIGLLGLWLKTHKTWPGILGISLLASILFFIVTNFAVWAVPQSLYPHTWQGLTQSYIMGLPFFRNTLLGDLFYVGTMFGLMEAVLRITSRWRLQKEGNVIRISRVHGKRV